MKIDVPKGDNYLLALVSLPPTQKAVIDVLYSCKDDELLMHLKGFKQWVWEKGDIQTWAPVINRFDDLLYSYVMENKLGTNGLIKSCENDKKVKYVASDELILEVLNLTVMILESCTSKNQYNSMEYLTLLLDSFNCDIVFGAVRVLGVCYSLIRRNRRSGSPKESPELQARLPLLCESPIPNDAFSCARLSDDIFEDTKNERSVVVAEQSYSNINCGKVHFRGTNDNAKDLKMPNGLKAFEAAVDKSDVLKYYISDNSPVCHGVYLEINICRSLRQGEFLNREPDVGTNSLGTNAAAALDNEKIQGDDVGGSCESSQQEEDKRSYVENVKIPYKDLMIFGNEEGRGAVDCDKNSESSGEYAIMQKVFDNVVKKYDIPEQYHSLIRHKMRILRGVYSFTVRKKLVDIRLAALSCLLCVGPSWFTHFLSSNPSFILELVNFIKNNRKLNQITMVVATELLTSLIQDRIHYKTLSSLLGISSPNGVFITVLRKYLSHPWVSKPLPKLISSKLEATSASNFLSSAQSSSDVVAERAARGRVGHGELRGPQPFLAAESSTSYRSTSMFCAPEEDFGHWSSSDSDMDVEAVASNASAVDSSAASSSSEFVGSLHSQHEIIEETAQFAASSSQTNISVLNEQRPSTSATAADCVVTSISTAVPSSTSATFLNEKQNAFDDSLCDNAEDEEDKFLHDWTKRLSTTKGLQEIRDKEEKMQIVQQLLMAYVCIFSNHSNTGALTHIDILTSFVDYLRIRDPVFIPVVLYVVRSLESLLEYSKTAIKILQHDLKFCERFLNRLQYDIAKLQKSRRFESINADSVEYPEGWLYPKAFNNELEQCAYWSFLGEDIARRCALKTIMKDMRICIRSLDMTQRPHVINLFTPGSVPTRVFRNVLQNPKKFGLGIYGAALTFLADFLNEDPASQPTLIKQGIIPDLLSSIVEDNLKCEEVLHTIGAAVNSIFMYNSGIKQMMKLNYAPVLYVIKILGKPDFVLFDRFGEVAAGLGESLEEIASLHNPSIPVLMKAISSMLQELLIEAKQYPPWRHIPPKVAHAKMLDYQEGTRMNIEHLEIAEIPSDGWLADRLSNIARFLQPYLIYEKNVRPFLAENGARMLVELCCVDALPPAFLHVHPQHPVSQLIKRLGNSSFIPGSTFYSQIISLLPSCVAAMERIKKTWLSKNLSGGVAVFWDEQIRSEAVSFVSNLHKIDSIVYLFYVIHRDTPLFSSNRLQCLTQTQQLVLDEIANVLKSLTPLLPWLFVLMYRQANMNIPDSPLLLSSRHFPHEHPAIRAVKNSASQTSLVGQQARQLGDQQLSTNDLFWTTQAQYSYNIANPAVEDVPAFSNEAKTSSSACSETPLDIGNSCCIGKSSEACSENAFYCKTVATEVLRSALITLRGFAGTLSRLYNMAPTRKNKTNNQAIISVQQLHCLHLAVLCRDLLDVVPEVPLPSTPILNELLPNSNVITAEANNETQNKNTISINIQGLSLVQSVMYISEIMDFLYKLHIDNKNHGCLLTMSVDYFHKIGGVDRVIRATHFCCAAYFALACTKIMKDDNKNETSVDKIFSFSDSADEVKSDFTLKNWLKAAYEEINVLDKNELRKAVDCGSKCLQCCLSYSEKLTSWKRIINSPVSQNLQKNCNRSFNYKLLESVVKSDAAAIEATAAKESESKNAANISNISAIKSLYKEGENLSSDEATDGASALKAPVSFVYSRVIENAPLEIISFDAPGLLRSIQSEVARQLIVWWRVFKNPVSEEFIGVGPKEAVFATFAPKPMSCLLKVLFHLLDTLSESRRAHIRNWAQDILNSNQTVLRTVNNTFAGHRSIIADPSIHTVDETCLNALVEMGFDRQRAETAFLQTGTNSVDVAADWLIANPAPCSTVAATQSSTSSSVTMEGASSNNLASSGGAIASGSNVTDVVSNTTTSSMLENANSQVIIDSLPSQRGSGADASYGVHSSVESAAASSSSIASSRSGFANGSSGGNGAYEVQAAQLANRLMSALIVRNNNASSVSGSSSSTLSSTLSVAQEMFERVVTAMAANNNASTRDTNFTVSSPCITIVSGQGSCVGGGLSTSSCRDTGTTNEDIEMLENVNMSDAVDLPAKADTKKTAEDSAAAAKSEQAFLCVAEKRVFTVLTHWSDKNAKLVGEAVKSDMLNQLLTLGCRIPSCVPTICEVLIKIVSLPMKLCGAKHYMDEEPSKTVKDDQVVSSVPNKDEFNDTLQIPSRKLGTASDLKDNINKPKSSKSTSDDAEKKGRVEEKYKKAKSINEVQLLKESNDPVECNIYETVQLLYTKLQNLESLMPSNLNFFLEPAPNLLLDESLNLKKDSKPANGDTISFFSTAENVSADSSSVIMMKDSSTSKAISQRYHEDLYALFYFLANLLHRRPIAKRALFEIDENCISLFVCFVKKYCDKHAEEDDKDPLRFRMKGLRIYPNLFPSLSLPIPEWCFLDTPPYQAQQVNKDVKFKEDPEEERVIAIPSLAKPGSFLVPAFLCINEIIGVYEFYDPRSYFKAADACACLPSLANSSNVGKVNRSEDVHMSTGSSPVFTSEKRGKKAFCRGKSSRNRAAVSASGSIGSNVDDTENDLETTKVLPKKCQISNGAAEHKSEEIKFLRIITEEKQAEMVFLCLDVLHHFPGCSGNLVLVILQVLCALTAVQANAIHMLSYVPKGLQHFKSSVSAAGKSNESALFLDKIGGVDSPLGGGLGVLLKIPRTAQCNGVLKLVSVILCQLMDDASVLAALMEQKLVQLFSTKQRTENTAVNFRLQDEGGSNVDIDLASSVSYTLEEVTQRLYLLIRRNPSLFEDVISSTCAIMRVSSSLEDQQGSSYEKEKAGSNDKNENEKDFYCTRESNKELAGVGKDKREDEEDIVRSDIANCMNNDAIYFAGSSAAAEAGCMAESSQASEVQGFASNGANADAPQGLKSEKASKHNNLKSENKSSVEGAAENSVVLCLLPEKERYSKKLKKKLLLQKSPSLAWPILSTLCDYMLIFFNLQGQSRFVSLRQKDAKKKLGESKCATSDDFSNAACWTSLSEKNWELDTKPMYPFAFSGDSIMFFLDQLFLSYPNVLPLLVKLPTFSARTGGGLLSSHSQLSGADRLPLTSLSSPTYRTNSKGDLAGAAGGPSSSSSLHGGTLSPYYQKQNKSDFPANAASNCNKMSPAHSSSYSSSIAELFYISVSPSWNFFSCTTPIVPVSTSDNKEKHRSTNEVQAIVPRPLLSFLMKRVMPTLISLNMPQHLSPKKFASCKTALNVSEASSESFAVSSISNKQTNILCMLQHFVQLLVTAATYNLDVRKKLFHEVPVLLKHLSAFPSSCSYNTNNSCSVLQATNKSNAAQHSELKKGATHVKDHKEPLPANVDVTALYILSTLLHRLMSLPSRIPSNSLTSQKNESTNDDGKNKDGGSNAGSSIVDNEACSSAGAVISNANLISNNSSSNNNSSAITGGCCFSSRNSSTQTRHSSTNGSAGYSGISNSGLSNFHNNISDSSVANSSVANSSGRNMNYRSNNGVAVGNAAGVGGGSIGNINNGNSGAADEGNDRQGGKDDKDTKERVVTLFLTREQMSTLRHALSVLLRHIDLHREDANIVATAVVKCLSLLTSSEALGAVPVDKLQVGKSRNKKKLQFPVSKTVEVGSGSSIIDSDLRVDQEEDAATGWQHGDVILVRDGELHSEDEEMDGLEDVLDELAGGGSNEDDESLSSSDSAPSDEGEDGEGDDDDATHEDEVPQPLPHEVDEEEQETVREQDDEMDDDDDPNLESDDEDDAPRIREVGELAENDSIEEDDVVASGGANVADIEDDHVEEPDEDVGDNHSLEDDEEMSDHENEGIEDDELASGTGSRRNNGNTELELGGEVSANGVNAGLTQYGQNEDDGSVDEDSDSMDEDDGSVDEDDDWGDEQDDMIDDDGMEPDDDEFSVGQNDINDLVGILREEADIHLDPDGARFQVALSDVGGNRSVIPTSTASTNNITSGWSWNGDLAVPTEHPLLTGARNCPSSNSNINTAESLGRHDGDGYGDILVDMMTNWADLIASQNPRTTRHAHQLTHDIALPNDEVEQQTQNFLISVLRRRLNNTMRTVVVHNEASLTETAQHVADNTVETLDPQDNQNFEEGQHNIFAREIGNSTLNSDVTGNERATENPPTRDHASDICAESSLTTVIQDSDVPQQSVADSENVDNSAIDISSAREEAEQTSQGGNVSQQFYDDLQRAIELSVQESDEVNLPASNVDLPVEEQGTTNLMMDDVQHAQTSEVADPDVQGNSHSEAQIATSSKDTEVDVAIELNETAGGEETSQQPTYSYEPLRQLATLLGVTEPQLLEAAGIDPSFLEALPDDLRSEIIVQQLRTLDVGIIRRYKESNRQEAAKNAETSAAPAAVSDGNATTDISEETSAALSCTINSATDSAASSSSGATMVAASAASVSVNSDSSLSNTVGSSATQFVSSMLETFTFPLSDSASSAAAVEALSGETVNSHIVSQAEERNRTAEDSNSVNVRLIESINAQFLDALPGDLRLEIFQNADGRSSNSNATRNYVDEIDNATFLATLDPTLRQEVLLSASQEFLNTLPSEIMAEANLIRERALQRQRAHQQQAAQNASRVREVQATRQSSQVHMNGVSYTALSVPRNNPNVILMQHNLSSIGGQLTVHANDLADLLADLGHDVIRRSSNVSMAATIGGARSNGLGMYISPSVATVTSGIPYILSTHGHRGTSLRRQLVRIPTTAQVQQAIMTLFGNGLSNNSSAQARRTGSGDAIMRDLMEELGLQSTSVCATPDYSTLYICSEPPLDTTALIYICRLMYLRIEVNKKLMFNLLCNLAAAYPTTRRALMQLLMVIMWSAAPDLYNLKGKPGPPAMLRHNFPPTLLFAPLDKAAITQSTICFERTLTAVNSVASERILEQLRSILTVLPTAADFFCTLVVHPCDFVIDDDTTLLTSAKSSTGSRNVGDHSLSNASSFTATQKNKHLPSQHAATNMVTDTEGDSNLLVHELKRKKKRRDSGSAVAYAVSSPPNTSATTEDDTCYEYPINVLLKLTSASLFLSSPKHMHHLLSAIHFLIVGGSESTAQTSSNTAATSASLSRCRDASASSTPAVASSSSISLSSSNSSCCNVRCNEGGNETLVTTETAKLDDKKDIERMKRSLQERIISVISSEAGESLCDLLCSQSLHSMWSQQTVPNYQSGGGSNQLQIVAQILGKLYKSVKHRGWVEGSLKLNATALCFSISKELKILEAAFAEMIENSDKSADSLEDICDKRDQLEPLLVAFLRLYNTLQSVFREVDPLQDSFKNNKKAPSDTVNATQALGCPSTSQHSSTSLQELTHNSDESGALSSMAVSNQNNLTINEQVRSDDVSGPSVTTESNAVEESLNKRTSLEILRDFLDITNVDKIWQQLDSCLRTMSHAYPSLMRKQLSSEYNAFTHTDEIVSSSCRSNTTSPNSLTGAENFAQIIGSEAAGTLHTSNEHTGTSLLHDSSPPLILNHLLPLLEAYLLVHLVGIAADYGFVSQNDEKIVLLATDADAVICDRHARLMQFCERHRKSFNALIKQSPLLLSGCLSPLIQLAPSCINFENKRHYFRHKLRELRQGIRYESIRLNVRREQVFTDSYYQLRMRSGDEMKGKLSVHFQGEEGVDAGGLSREWFSILAKEMFNPDYALFRREGSKAEFNHPNPLSHINPDHLHFFKFIGRVIGKVIYDGQHLEAYFCRSFYKHMLGRKTKPSDAESIDPEFYSSLLKLIEYPLDDLGLELHFSTEIDEFGCTKVLDLMPNGRNVPVTDENKELYVKLMCEQKVSNGIKEQLDAFLSGFHELIPPKLISIFDDKELELLISGIPIIDLEDLKRNTEYHNYDTDSPQIKWFWQVLEELDQNRLAAFLQFVTGTSRVPLDGFKNLIGMRGPQKFSIHRAYGENRLPSAHTCFNQLDLPQYATIESLRSKLLQAIVEGKEGFGFV